MFYSKRIQKDIDTHGYSIVKAADVHWHHVMDPAWMELSHSFNNLPLDSYLIDGGQYRRRRYGRFIVTAKSGELKQLPNTGFLQQSEEVNRLYQGKVRYFEPIETATASNRFLATLIVSDLDVFPICTYDNSASWCIDVHQVRICCTPDTQGLPTPEGVHHDGQAFVAMHLIRRSNVAGGISTLYSSDCDPIDSVELELPMDSVFVDDSRVMHAVSSITPTRMGQDAIRDMLLLNFNPVA